MTALPMFFVVAAGATLLSAIYAIWQSLRAAFGQADRHELEGALESEGRRALLDRKAALLASLRDLRFDHEAGKIADGDFTRLEAKLKDEAKDTLRLLDKDIEPFRKQAEKLVRERLEAEGKTPYRAAGRTKKAAADTVPCPACGTANEPAASVCVSCDASLQPVVCGACDTKNDPDAQFCKKCGAGLGEKAADTSDADAGDGTVSDAEAGEAATDVEAAAEEESR